MVLRPSKLDEPSCGSIRRGEFDLGVAVDGGPGVPDAGDGADRGGTLGDQLGGQPALAPRERPQHPVAAAR